VSGVRPSVIYDVEDVKRSGRTYRCRRFTLAPIGRVLLDAQRQLGSEEGAGRDEFLTYDAGDGTWWASVPPEEARRALSMAFPQEEPGDYSELHRAFRAVAVR
jgi:hypothetical protein